MTDQPAGSPELLLYQTEDGRARIQCRFEDGTVGPPGIVGDAG